jgi:predicted flap endonuclease-1-like 5' DNA nuclease
MSGARFVHTIVLASYILRFGVSAQLQRQLEQQTARVTELEAAHSELTRQLVERDVHLRELEAALAAARTAVLRLEAQLVEARAYREASAPDDLKVLRGIGPSLERALNALGVQHLEQIAAWSEEDIWNIAGKLRTNPERLLRYNWIGGAREELQRKPSPG